MKLRGATTCFLGMALSWTGTPLFAAPPTVRVVTITLGMNGNECKTRPDVDPSSIDVYPGDLVLWRIYNNCADKPERKVGLKNFKRNPSGPADNPFEFCGNLEREKVYKDGARFIACMVERNPNVDVEFKYDVKGTDVFVDPVIVIRRPPTLPECDVLKKPCP